jgi:hypothetical protein
MVAVAHDAVKALQQLALASDALAFIANQVERRAVAAEQQAQSARVLARAEETQAVVAVMGAGMLPAESCRACSTAMFPWETFCKICGTEAVSELGTGSYDSL